MPGRAPSRLPRQRMPTGANTVIGRKSTWRIDGSFVRRVVWSLLVLAVIAPRPGWAQSENGSIRGTVVDQLGARVEATVILLRAGQRVNDTATTARRGVRFRSACRRPLPGRGTGRRLRVGRLRCGLRRIRRRGAARGRAPRSGRSSSMSSSRRPPPNLPQARVGSPVTVIDRGMLQDLAKPDVLEALRTVPGLQVVQTGQRGGTTSVFVRGGAADFNKVLIDGVPANDIGGAIDFDTLSTSAFDRVEVLRSSNSILYGSDALSGVISLTTRRGSSRRPEVSYSIDGGNLGTVRQELSVGGLVDRFDYFVDLSRFDTDNDIANNAYRKRHPGRAVRRDAGPRDRPERERAADRDRLRRAGRHPLQRHRGRFVADERPDACRDHRPNAVDRPLAEQRAVRLDRTPLHLRESCADRGAVRSVRFRTELPRQRGHDRRRQRVHDEWAGDPGLWRTLSVGVRRGDDAADGVRPSRLLRLGGVRYLRRRSARARGGHVWHLRIDRADERRRVRRGAREPVGTRVPERRRRLRAS